MTKILEPASTEKSQVAEAYVAVVVEVLQKSLPMAVAKFSLTEAEFVPSDLN